MRQQHFNSLPYILCQYTAQKVFEIARPPYQLREDSSTESVGMGTTKNCSGWVISEQVRYPTLKKYSSLVTMRLTSNTYFLVHICIVYIIQWRSYPSEWRIVLEWSAIAHQLKNNYNASLFIALGKVKYIMYLLRSKNKEQIIRLGNF